LPYAGCWLSRRHGPIMCRRSGQHTGGIIAYHGVQMDVRQLAVDHCAYYGKVVKFLAVQPQYGGYISFACRWVPYAPTTGAGHPLLNRTISFFRGVREHDATACLVFVWGRFPALLLGLRRVRWKYPCARRACGN